MLDYVNERAHALDYYDRAGVSRRKSEGVIDAFLAKGFVLRDIGGGDIVWRQSFGQRDPELALEVVGNSVKTDREDGLFWRMVTGLDEPVAVTTIIEDGTSGIYFAIDRARRMLESIGMFNLERVDE